MLWANAPSFFLIFGNATRSGLPAWQDTLRLALFKILKLLIEVIEVIEVADNLEKMNNKLSQNPIKCVGKRELLTFCLGLIKNLSHDLQSRRGHKEKVYHFLCDFTQVTDISPPLESVCYPGG